MQQMNFLTYALLFSSVVASLQFQNNNGFNIFAFDANALALPETLTSLYDIALMGSNWVAVNFIISQDSQNASQVHLDDRTPTSAVWSTFVHKAHEHRLRVLAKPLVLCGDTCTFFNIMPDDVQLWFSSYSEIIHNMSMMAQLLGIDAFSIGLELYQLTTDQYASYWRALIYEIRQSGYTGLLTYCSVFYPVETQQIQFWDLLDFIGMDFYLPLLNITHNTIIPTQEQMIERFTVYFKRLQQWKESQPLIVKNKPILLTETGYPSSLAGLAAPFANLPNRCVGNYSANFTLQNLAFQAFFQSMKENPGIISGSIIFWWENPSSRDFDHTGSSSVWPCSWSPHGKLAECTIATAFGGLCSAMNRGSRLISSQSYSLIFILMLTMLE